MKSRRILLAAFCSILVTQNIVYAQTPSLVVKAGQPGAPIQPTMWGIFFEDINFAADGGIYAELVKNRSFEFYKPMMGWKEQKKPGAGSTLIINRGEEHPANPRFARVTVNAQQGDYGIANEGFRGIGLTRNQMYNFSVLARVQEGSVKFRVEFVDANNKVEGSVTFEPSGNEWKKYKTNIIADNTDPKAKMILWFEGNGVVDIDMVSLFPYDTWKNRPGGLRRDLVQLLADLKPGFLRFPGGCIVEGFDLATRYQWKKTVGDIEGREVLVNRWNTEFKHRPTPDYYQSFGMGFYEYFLLAEDIGAAPLPILSCGMACQFNSAEVVPMDQLDPYIQDALDLIEFANGSPQTTWGKVRADMGHAAPFNLTMIGIGNEQWGPQYIERYKVFVKAIKEKYPNVRIVTGTGPAPSGELFDYANKELRAFNAEIIDEHYYKAPDWFLKNTNRYDDYDRNGPKIFAGEYAAQNKDIASAENQNTWQCAMAEAAFMTGLERNAAVVHMASYAPLFAHVEGWQWTPDLIWFDNLRSYGTPNYYVQKLFSTNKGSKVLPILLEEKAIEGQNNLYASSVVDEKTNEIIVKIVNASAEARQTSITFDGVKKLNPKGELTILKSDKPDAVNSLDDPRHVAPVVQSITVKGKKIDVSLPPLSFSVIKIKRA